MTMTGRTTMTDHGDTDLDDLIEARGELLDELAELEAAIAELVSDELECSAEDDD